LTIIETATVSELGEKRKQDKFSLPPLGGPGDGKKGVAINSCTNVAVGNFNEPMSRPVSKS
jgi:hypothetical protein